MKTLHEIEDALLDAIIDLDEAKNSDQSSIAMIDDATLNLRNARFEANEEIKLRNAMLAKEISKVETETLIGEIQHIQNLLNEYKA